MKKVYFFITVLVIIWLAGALYVRRIAAPAIFPQFWLDDSHNKNSYDFPITRAYRTNGAGNKIEIISVQEDKSKGVILYFHGNAGRKSNIIEDASKFATVVSPAYPGYNLSEGAPTFANIHETADITMKYIEDLGYKPQDVTVVGHSLGGNVALYTAQKYPVKKLVLINTFSSVISQCWPKYYILCAFTGDLLNSAKIAETITVPVREFHDKNDATIPYQQGVELFSHFKNPDKQFYTIDGDHNNFDLASILNK